MGCSGSHSKEKEKKEDNQDANKKINLMSKSLERLLTSKNPEDLLAAYIKLDKNILEEENKSPSSVFGQAMSRQQQIKALIQTALEIKNQNEILSEECSIFDLFVDLGLLKNSKIAMEHEEFIASINRRAVNQNIINLLEKMLEAVEDDIKSSSERIRQLQRAYQQQDELLGQIFRETYGSDTERHLEKEVDTMRYYRDILSTGALQWEVCATNIQTAKDLLQKGMTCWESLKNQSLENKINSATEARDYIEEGILLIQTSEDLLQDVQFPFCTRRELREVSQTMDYVFTDILIEEKHARATEVYTNFVQRATSLHEWIKQVLNSKLKKDLFEIEEKVSDLTNQLRNERIYLICRKLKIENPSEDLLSDVVPIRAREAIIENRTDPNNLGDRQIFDYDKFPINLESRLGINQNRNNEHVDVQKYFQKILENKKNTMWPSRRIDELQTLMLQDKRS